jgi:hypothetical protein
LGTKKWHGSSVIAIRQNDYANRPTPAVEAQTPLVSPNARKIARRVVGS